MKKQLVVAGLLWAVGAASALFAADGTWSSATGGNWSDTANWSGGTSAGGSGSTAYFTAGSGTVTNDTAGLALLGLQLAGSGFLLTGNALTLSGGGGITALSGDHEVALPVTLSGPAGLTAASNQTLTVSGAISGTGGVTLNGGRVLLTSSNTYSGVTTNQTGLLDVTTFDALGGSSTDPANLVLGKGTFRYSGSTPAALSRGFTIRTSGGNAACVFDIRTNATFSGKIVPVTGPVVKTGPGTLTYAYSGYETMNQGTGGILQDSPFSVDANGNAGTNGYCAYCVAEGKILFNTAGQTNRFTSNVTIGIRTATPAYMELDNGVVQVPDTWFSISRGNGTNTAPLSSTVTVNGGRLELWGLVMAYGAGAPSFNSWPVLNQTGGEIAIAGDAYLTETSGGNSTVNLSGGKLTCDGLSQGFALNVWANSGVSATLNVSGSAQAYFAKLAVKNLGTVNVTNGGLIGVRSTPSSNAGTVNFDNGTLTTYAPGNQPCEWFHNTTKLNVRAGGLNVHVPTNQYAFLSTAPTADTSSPGGKIVKKGGGTFALYSCELPIDVNEGCLRLMGAHITTNKPSKTISLSDGAQLELAAPHAAESNTLALAGAARLNLTVADWAARTELWKFNGAAISRTDGALEILPNSSLSVGSVFMTRILPVTNAWSVGFSVAAVAGRPNGSQGDGVAFVIQNDARGTSAYSTNVLSGFGYAGGAAPITNSFAVALDLTNRQLRFGTNGVFASAAYDLSTLPGLGSDLGKTYFTVSYDGAGTVSCTLTRNGLKTLAYTFPANLQALAGNTWAYMGFTAGNTSGRYEEHLVRDVTVSSGAAAVRSYVQYGGQATLASGQTLGVSLNPAQQQNGFGLGQLTYADGGILDIRQPTFAATPTPTLTDQGLWNLTGKACWKGAGRLAISSNYTFSGGTAYTTNLYPVTGSWTARFKYDIGQMSTPPADYITFTVQNLSSTSTDHTPNPGFAIMWRYYENGVTNTSLRMYTNNVAVLATTNIAPVSLPTGGAAVMTVRHDASAKTVTVITEQAAGSSTNVFTGVDMAAAVRSQTAYLGFGAFTGGYFAENIVSGFSFVYDSAAADTAWQRGYLAVGAASGSGTLIKKGNGALGIQDGPDNPFTNATVRLDEGGLVLRKFVCEPVTLGDDFYLSPVAMWAPAGALQVMPSFSTQRGVGVTAKRHTVSQPWTARFTFFTGARSTSPADGFSFFVHNDSRGPSALGGLYSGAGYAGINNSIALEWNYYEGDAMSNTVVLGVNGGWSGARRSNLPIKITTIQQETDMTIRHDPVAKTLALTMVQGTNSFATTFTGVDIRSSLGSDFGYIGFGGGSGGQYCEARVKDFTFALDAPTNPLPAANCLGTAVLPAGTSNVVSLATVVSNAAFAVGALQLGDGATFGLESIGVSSGSLTVGQTALGGAAAFSVGAGTTLVLTNVTGGASVAKYGPGLLQMTGAATGYTGGTLLCEGTLSLPSPLLPATTDLAVTNGATLNLAFVGKQYVHTLVVNGVQMHGGQYTAARTAWITGTGTLVVTYPPVGTILFVK